MLINISPVFFFCHIRIASAVNWPNKRSPFYMKGTLIWKQDVITIRVSSHTSEGVQRDIKKSTIACFHIILDIWIIIILFKIILYFWMAHVVRLILHNHLLSLTKMRRRLWYQYQWRQLQGIFTEKKKSAGEKPWESFISSAEKMAETNH